MIGLPKSTEFNRRIPKQKFYENISVSPTLKRVFIDQINRSDQSDLLAQQSGCDNYESCSRRHCDGAGGL